jgi:RNA polymerase sigma-70 factor (ECF subfamily)
MRGFGFVGLERFGMPAPSFFRMANPLRLVASDGLSVAAPVTEAGAFEAFFEAESPTLFRRLCLVTGNRHEAEEVMQDAFISVFERWDRVGAMENPTGYLYRTAFRVVSRRWRRAARALEHALRRGPEMDEFAQADHRESLRRALGSLTLRQRTAVVLTELLDYSSDEAATVMGVRPVTVRVLASQARAAMRPMLEDRDE